MSKFKKIVTSVFCASVILSFALSPVVSMAREVSFSELVEILISIGVISPEKATQARFIASQSADSNATATLPSSSTPFASSTFSFSRDFAMGYTGQEILILQRILNADTATQVSISGAGSPGNETSTFGPATKIALIKFQKKYGISQTGKVDANTRTILNSVVVAQRINALPKNQQPSIIVKANGQTGNASVQPASLLTLSWTSQNVYDCTSPRGSKPISGTQVVSNPQSAVYAITCQSDYGPVTGYVNVVVPNQNNSSNTLVAGNNSSQNVYPYSYQNQTSGTNGGYSYTNYQSGPSYTVSAVNTPGSACSVSNPSGVPSTQYGFSCASQLASQNTSVASASTLISHVASSNTSITTRYLDLSSGVTGYVSVQNSPSLTIDNKLTIEAWIKPTAWNGNQIIVIKGQEGKNWDYGLSVKNGVLQFSNSRAEITTFNPVVSLNTWSHVAVVVDESQSDSVIFYVNGVKVGGSTIKGDCGNSASTTPSSGTEDLYGNNASSTDYFSQLFNESYSGFFAAGYSTSQSQGVTKQYLLGRFNNGSWLQTSNYPLDIGGYYNTSGTGSLGLKNRFVGMIDDVRIWNTARTEGQIKSNAITLASSTSEAVGLAARWNFDNGDASDSGVNNNNGTLNGSAVISQSQSINIPNISASSAGISSYIPAINQCVDVTDGPLAPEGPLPAFGGQVVSISECKNGDGNGGKTYQVVIKACNPGDQIGTSKGGDPVYDLGYITFRENNPPLPAIGDSILGGEVPDESGKCDVNSATTQPSGGTTDAPWIGDASGPLGEGPACTNDTLTTGVVDSGGSGGGHRFGGQTVKWTASGAAVGATIGAIGGPLTAAGGAVVGGVVGLIGGLGSDFGFW
jgi:hypothetical protein